MTGSRSAAWSVGPYGPGVAARVARVAWRGELDGATHHGRATNPVCGDEAEVWIRVAGAVIEAVRWRASGCPPTLAALDLASERIEGATTSAARALTPDELADALEGLPRTSRHACALAVDAIAAALGEAPAPGAAQAAAPSS